MVNTRQKKFVDEYIKSGNASKSARLAGYSAENSDVQGAKLLADERIKKEIKRRLDEIHEESTATLKETLSVATAIMRGELREETAISVGVGKSARIEKVELPPKISTRLDAAKFLHKVLSTAAEVDKELTITIIPAERRKFRDDSDFGTSESENCAVK